MLNINIKAGMLAISFLAFWILPSGILADSWDYRKKSRIKWRDYNASAFSEAKKKNRPLYVFVFSNTCSWCVKFESETLEQPLIRKLLEENYIPVAVDLLKQEQLAKKLGIRLVPASIILTPDGKKLLRFYGFLTYSALSSTLNKTLLAWKKGELPGDDFGDKTTCCPIPH